MTRATDAADAIRRAAKQYEAFTFAAEFLDRVGSLEQATVEAERATSEANSARDKAIAERDVAVMDATKAKETALEIVDSASRRRAEILASAEAEAQTTKNHGAELLAATKAETEERCAGMISKAQASLDLIKAETVTTQRALDEANATLAMVEDKADVAEARLAKAQAAIAKMLSGT